MSRKPSTRIGLATKAAGILQSELADMIGMDADILREKASGQMLRKSQAMGRKRLTETEIFLISDCLGISPRWIAGKGSLEKMPSVLNTDFDKGFFHDWNKVQKEFRKLSVKTTSILAEALLAYLVIKWYRTVHQAIRENKLLFLQAVVFTAIQNVEKAFNQPRFRNRFRDALNVAMAEKWHLDVLKCLEEEEVEDVAKSRIRLILEGLRQQFQSTSKTVLLPAEIKKRIQKIEENPAQQMPVWSIFRLFEEKVTRAQALHPSGSSAEAPQKTRADLDKMHKSLQDGLRQRYGGKIRNGTQKPKRGEGVTRAIGSRKKTTANSNRKAVQATPRNQRPAAHRKTALKKWTGKGPAGGKAIAGGKGTIRAKRRGGRDAAKTINKAGTKPSEGKSPRKKSLR